MNNCFQTKFRPKLISSVNHGIKERHKNTQLDQLSNELTEFSRRYLKDLKKDRKNISQRGIHSLANQYINQSLKQLNTSIVTGIQSPDRLLKDKINLKFSQGEHWNKRHKHNQFLDRVSKIKTSLHNHQEKSNLNSSLVFLTSEPHLEQKYQLRSRNVQLRIGLMKKDDCSEL